MTRINASIKVKLLTDEHLLAEHREIKRIPNIADKSRNSKRPSEFVLGTGHVLFFMDKMKYLYNRYVEIHKECLNRGFVVDDYSDSFLKWKDSCLWQDWNPDERVHRLLVERISQKIKESRKETFRYYREKIDKDDAVKLLNK